MRRINVMALIGIIFLNLVLILGAAITIYALLASAWIAIGSFILSPVLLIGAAVTGVQAFNIFQFILSIALAGLGFYLVPLLQRVTGIIVGLTKSYLALNLKAIYY